MPTNRRLKSFAARSVVPLPAKGSSTMSPGFDHDATWSFASLSGNGAGCHTITPPGFSTRQSSRATPSKSHVWPPVRRSSYGGDVTTRSILSDGRPDSICTLSPHRTESHQGEHGDAANDCPATSCGNSRVWRGAVMADLGCWPNRSSRPPDFVSHPLASRFFAPKRVQLVPRLRLHADRARDDRAACRLAPRIFSLASSRLWLFTLHLISVYRQYSFLHCLASRADAPRFGFSLRIYAFCLISSTTISIYAWAGRGPVCRIACRGRCVPFLRAPSRRIGRCPPARNR